MLSNSGKEGIVNKKYNPLKLILFCVDHKQHVEASL